MKVLKKYEDEQRETAWNWESSCIWAKKLWEYLRWGNWLEHRHRSETALRQKSNEVQSLSKMVNSVAWPEETVHGKSSCEIKLKRYAEEFGCSAKAREVIRNDGRTGGEELDLWSLSPVYFQLPKWMKLQLPSRAIRKSTSLESGLLQQENSFFASQ